MVSSSWRSNDSNWIRDEERLSELKESASASMKKSLVSSTRNLRDG